MQQHDPDIPNSEQPEKADAESGPNVPKTLYYKYLNRVDSLSSASTMAQRPTICCRLRVFSNTVSEQKGQLVCIHNILSHVETARSRREER